VALVGGDVLCVANEQHRLLVRDAVETSGLPGKVLLEPCPRNTAPALTCAALLLHGHDPGALLLCSPSDHDIPDAEAFAATVQRAIPAAAAGWLVTFGIVPDHPATGYGYISGGRRLSGGSPAVAVARFVEKPDSASAAQLVRQGCLWNAGIILARVDTLLEAIGRHAPDILAACRAAVEACVEDEGAIRLGALAFGACRSQSIDHAVLERHDRVAMVPFHGTWNDLGSWESLSAHLDMRHHMAGRGQEIAAVPFWTAGAGAVAKDRPRPFSRFGIGARLAPRPRPHSSS
jgi:mannose-1-phosphate guanylyltransferase/mannose-6-phosphate isomerase